jgi:chitodextrinase
MAALAASGNVYKSMEQVPAQIGVGTRVQVEDEMWDYVDQVPAAAMESYSRVVETLYDSSAVDGLHWSVFVVSGHTELTYWWTVSAPDSGYSIDNLAPMAPMSLKASEDGQGVTLQWDAPIDADFKYFEIYRGETSTFDPNAVGALAKMTDNKFVDANVQAGKSYYYKVAAYDFAGNRSAFSSISHNVTSVAGRDAVPENFELGQNYPNPFNPSTHISFGLPKQQHISIKIYDLRGAMVRTLASGTFSAGSHQLSWDGRNDNGQIAGAGTYLYRLESEGATITRKMIFLK